MNLLHFLPFLENGIAINCSILSNNKILWKKGKRDSIACYAHFHNACLWFLWFGIVWCWRSISCFRLLASLPYMSILTCLIIFKFLIENCNHIIIHTYSPIKLRPFSSIQYLCSWGISATKSWYFPFQPSGTKSSHLSLHHYIRKVYRIQGCFSLLMQLANL